MTTTRAIQRYHSGSLPFAVDVFLGTYEGPGWVRQKLRGKSGWMQLSRARMDTPVSTWRATLVAARTDDGENLGTMTSSAFLSMRSSGPRELDLVPPDELDTLSEMLFWDFLGRCDLRHLRMLREAETEADERIASEQSRGERVLAEADTYIANLRRQRRSLAVGDERRDRLEEQVAFFEQKQAAAAQWLVRRLGAVREEVMALEADVMAALEHHGEVEELYTVRWTARHPADRIYSRERPDSFFLGPNPPKRQWNRTAEMRLARDRLYDDETMDERSSRLDLLREERRREWTLRMEEQRRQDAEREAKRQADLADFAKWAEAQKIHQRELKRATKLVEVENSRENKRLAKRQQKGRKAQRLTPAEAKALSATVREMRRAARRTKPEVKKVDEAARAELEQGAMAPPKSGIDEFHEWMKDVGLV